MKEKHNIFFRYIKDRKCNVFIYSIFAFIFFIVFYLYHLPLHIILYGNIICGVIAILLIIYDFYTYNFKHNKLIDIKNNITTTMGNLPDPKTLEEEDYQRLIRILYKDKIDLISKMDEKHTNLIEYYTLWTHQIKTPLSAIDFLLQSENDDIHEELELQVLEIEKYVDMALQYLRIDNMASDLMLGEYSIQEIIKKAIKSYSKLFIYKGINLNLEENDMKIITDEKWLLFVIKQILSNSLKYINRGHISIYTKGNMLIIEDTGIGICEEDILRIFEKGFTGYNGRINKKSTGLGLYLSKKVIDNLGHKITIYSKVDIGSKVIIDFSSRKLEIE